MNNRLRHAADAVTVVVGAIVLTVLGVRYFGPPPSPATDGAVPAGARIGASAGIDFSAGSPTVVLMLSEDCVFCQDSMPFYRTLMAHDTEEVQIVVAAPATELEIETYLASEDIVPDAVVFPSAGTLPVRGTPTILVVDVEGKVLHSWLGRLGPEGEAAVLDVVFDQ